MSDELTVNFHQEVLKASIAEDIGIIMPLFAEDAVLMPPNDTTVFGKDEIRSWWEEYFSFFRITSVVQTERDVTVAGNQAFERYSFSVTIVPKQRGARILDDIRSLTVWRREPDGNWRITHSMWNSTKPVGSGTNRYMNRMLQKKGVRSSS
jgi:ketosteroid isomerase-like protein